MKGLTRGLKQESVEKWQEIIRKIKRRDKNTAYLREYWHTCGFCKAATVTAPGIIKNNDSCIYCSLFKAKLCRNHISLTPYMGMTAARGKTHYNVVGEQPVSFGALVDADNHEWKSALEKAQRVLAVIEKTTVERQKKGKETR